MNILRNEAIERRLEKYRRGVALWKDDEQTLLADSSGAYCFKLPHESSHEYNYRKRLFVNGFINPTLELINAPGNVIFRSAPKIEIPDNSLTYAFANDVLRSGINKLSLTRWMQDIGSPMLRLQGTIFVLLNMPQEAPVSKQDSIDRKILPFITYISPLQVLNWEIEDGEFLWFAYEVYSRSPWTNFTKPRPPLAKEIHIWDRSNQYVIRGNKLPVITPHNFGFVPVVYQAACPDEEGGIVGDCTFFTSSKMILTANNFLTCANIEIMKYSSSMLLLHREALCAANSTTDSQGVTHLKKQFDDTSFVYEGERAPAYLTKDLASVDKSNTQYQRYMGEAVENEKSNRANKKIGMDGMDVVQSGIAKAIDRDPIEANITATATDCEMLHRKILDAASRMLEEGGEIEICVEYEKTFDIKSFEGKLKNLADFITQVKEYPSATGKREMYKTITSGITGSDETANIINAEIDKADVGRSTLSDAALFDALTSKPDGEE